MKKSIRVFDMDSSCFHGMAVADSFFPELRYAWIEEEKEEEKKDRSDRDSPYGYRLFPMFRNHGDNKQESEDKIGKSDKKKRGSWEDDQQGKESERKIEEEEKIRFAEHFGNGEKIT